MTSELRPEVEVASAVYDECRERGIRDGGALIKADREAVRAEQAAELAKFKALAETQAREIERLRELISDCRGSHWLKRTEWQGSQPHLDAIWSGLVETDDTRAALGDSHDQ